jgi:hypothetical protein
MAMVSFVRHDDGTAVLCLTRSQRRRPFAFDVLSLAGCLSASVGEHKHAAGLATWGLAVGSGLNELTQPRWHGQRARSLVNLVITLCNATDTVKGNQRQEPVAIQAPAVFSGKRISYCGD